MYNFHIYTLINTVIFFLMLKSYKRNITNNSDNSRLIYLLYLPILLYTTRYLLYNTTYMTESIKRIYPESMSSIYS